MSEDQISLPYFVVILVIFGFIIRYLFFNNGNTAARPGRSQEALARSREVAVERIQQMFPQTDRRSILWDLQRNGGSIQVTTERILAGRLDTVSEARPIRPQAHWRGNLGSVADKISQFSPQSPSNPLPRQTKRRLARMPGNRLRGRLRSRLSLI